MIKFLDKFFELFPEYESDDVSIPSSPCSMRSRLTRARSISPANLTLANTSPTSRRPSSIATPSPR